MIRLQTLTFLEKLKDNNSRDWFQANKAVYQSAKEDIENLAKELITHISKFDKNIINLEAKKCVFRLNRDIRFSKNKTPYKTHFGISINKGGRSADSAGYYLHIEPNNCFLGGGIHAPASPFLKKIRQEIDYNTAELREILAKKSFVQQFGKLQGSQLKTTPRSYKKENPAIDLLRFKDFLGLKNVADTFFLKENFVVSATETFEALHPLIEFLNRGLD